jgi:transcriptional regulator with XRE-family HTH domain
MRGTELVGRNVRRIRVSLGVSQERLAFDSKVDRSYLGGLERGEENPTVELLDRLAATLSVPLMEFFIEDGSDGIAEGLPRGRKPKSS